MYLMAINGARRSIDLEAAYFVPDQMTRTALEDAMHRGVQVRILVPGPYVDSKVVASASQAQWGAMLKAGAKMYRWQPSLLHDKLMVVDGYLTVAGSANFDNRSFQLNDEANINIYDEAFAAHITEVIEADIARATPLTYAQWQQRPWRQKVMDWLSEKYRPSFSVASCTEVREVAPASVPPWRPPQATLRPRSTLSAPFA